jgi:hypothetical protein
MNQLALFGSSKFPAPTVTKDPCLIQLGMPRPASSRRRPASFAAMGAAGLTHGGFYRHFQSKDRLAEACAAGMESIVAKAEDAACQSHSNGGLEAIIESYLASSTTLAFF